MRSITALTGLAATTAMLALAAPTGAATSGATTADGSTTERQRGVVMSCFGEADGLAAFVELYQNSRYPNSVAITLNEDPETSASRQPQNKVLQDGVVRTGVTIDGERARVRGTATRVGKRIPVHFEIDDAGYHIEDDGHHRRLQHDLVLIYSGTTVPLDCQDAFFFDLTTTRTPI